jgi:mono/diheme cytochrome c family protein
MIHMKTLASVIFAALLLLLGFAAAQETKRDPIKATSAGSGNEMYKEYCAVCHGRAGKGDGPAAAALKTPPPDLTMLAKNNGGKFPSEHVMAVLRFGVEETAHGTKAMPIWGPLFGKLGLKGEESTETKLRIFNLSKYVESIQTKDGGGSPTKNIWPGRSMFGVMTISN